MSIARSLVVVSLLVPACGGSTSDGISSPSIGDLSASDHAGPPSASDPTTAGTSPAASDTPARLSPVSSADGTATRVACTSSFGTALSTKHGRLDGYLVSVVPHSNHSCNGDRQHLHLQVEMNGEVYDVAVNVDGFEAEVTTPLPGAAWSEGWHAGEKLDYVKDLGLDSESFTLTGPSAVRQRIESAIANANHIAVYATGYGPTGAHLVHRQGSGRDGALVLDPLGASPRVIAFRFETQTF